MGLLKLLNSGQFGPSELENPGVPLSSTSLIDWISGPQATSGVRLTEQSSLGMPAVWRAVNLISSSGASLPLHAYKKGDVTRAVQSEGDAAGLIAKPHPDMTPFEVWEQVFAHQAMWGNAYLRKLRNQLGVVKELWPLHPSRVKAGRAKDGTKVYLVDGDADNPLTDNEILHIPGFGYDGVCGVSPIRLAREGIGLAMAAEQFGAKLFGSGSLAGGVLQTEQRLDQDQADRLKAAWKSKVGGGLQNAHEVAVLHSGAKFEQMTIPPDDAQFIESRKFQVSEVARIYGIPPHMLMDTDKSTSWGTGIEQQSIGFVVYTLRPWLTRAEQRLSTLFPDDVYVRFSVEGLLRGDTAARYEAYAQGRQWGWLSANDIRSLEELPPIDGGDAYLVPLNMTPSDVGVLEQEPA